MVEQSDILLNDRLRSGFSGDAVCVVGAMLVGDGELISKLGLSPQAGRF